MADSAPGGGVHIHTWSGQHTQNLSHEQLSLQEEDYIWAIQYSQIFRSIEGTLQLAVGDYGSETVHSLHAGKVSDMQEEVLGDHTISEESISF